jgi:heme/copper-type cytochrome/quinol oxidase subunit 2
MVTGLVHLHNILRWIILILLVLSIFRAYTGLTGKKTFSDGDRKTWLFTMIAAHTTLLLGVIQWLFGRYGVFTHPRQEQESFMKDKFFRFYWLEHPLMMIIVITFITLGYLQAKKPVADAVKYRKALIFFVLALLVTLAAIPWPFRTVIGRPLFPGM